MRKIRPGSCIQTTLLESPRKLPRRRGCNDHRIAAVYDRWYNVACHVTDSAICAVHVFEFDFLPFFDGDFGGDFEGLPVSTSVGSRDERWDGESGTTGAPFADSGDFAILGVNVNAVGGAVAVDDSAGPLVVGAPLG